MNLTICYVIYVKFKMLNISIMKKALYIFSASSLHVRYSLSLENKSYEISSSSDDFTSFLLISLNSINAPFFSEAVAVTIS